MGTSYERQLYAVKQWQELNSEIKVSGDSYEDLGLSGHNGEHLDNAFGRLLVAIKNNKIVKGDYILVEAIDRIGRLEPMEMLPLLQQIVNAGITIVTLDDLTEYNTRSLNNGLLQSLTGKFQQAYNYSKILSIRVAQSWVIRKEKARRGDFVKMRTPFWLDENQKLIPKYAEIIEKMFQWYLIGDGQRLIQRRLSDNWPEIFGDGFREDFLLRIKGNKSKIVNSSTIKKWLANKVAIGYWDDIPKVFPHAISDELFYKVQHALSQRTKRSSKPHHYFIGGLAKCICGSNMSPIHNKGANGQVYINLRCTTRGRLGHKTNEKGEVHGCGNGKTIPAIVADVIAHWCLPDVVKQLVIDQTDTQIKEKLAIVEGRLLEIDEKIEKCLDLVLEGIAAAADRVRKFDRTKNQLEAEKEILVSSIGNKADLSELNSLLEHENKYKKNYTKFNRLLQQTGYKLVCDGNLITVHIPDGQLLEFKYLKFDRAKGKMHSKNYTFIDIKNERITAIPFDEPLTKVDKDVDLVNDNLPNDEIILLENFEPNGKSINEVLEDTVLKDELLRSLASVVLSRNNLN